MSKRPTCLPCITDAGMACMQVFFFRTGQNWGNRAYFPKADPSLEPGEILAKPSSASSTTTSRRRG
jgi:excinuclease UvrABC nuclease subunit